MTRFPLTDLIIAMLKATPAELARADPAKIARKYGTDVNHTTGMIRLARGY